MIRSRIIRRNAKPVKRLLCLVLPFLFLLGCVPPATQQTPVPVPTAPEMATTPAPSPTDVPVRVLFVADRSSQEAADFFSGAAQSAQAEGWQINTYAGDDFADAISNEEYDGILALIMLKETSMDILLAASKGGVPVVIADMFQREPVAGTSYAYYDISKAASAALDAAIAYPPHDTPVRFIALLENKGSPADEAYREGVKQGRIFSKAKHYETDKQNAQDFMEKQLEVYVEGTVDAVYVESEQLAQAALNSLSDCGRTDMEVFCVPTGALSVQRGLYEKWTFPVLMGADLVAVGEKQARELADRMNGKEAQISSFAPVKHIPDEIKPME